MTPRRKFEDVRLQQLIIRAFFVAGEGERHEGEGGGGLGEAWRGAG